MLVHRLNRDWAAWAGLEVEQLSDLAVMPGAGFTGSQDDPTTTIDSNSTQILGSLAAMTKAAIEIRYRHEPRRQRPRMAILCRVHDRSERAVRTSAIAMVHRLRRFPSVELQTLPLDELRTDWLLALPRPPDWALVAQRRIVWSPSDDLWATESLTTTPDYWHELLAALWASPDPVILAVRLEPTTGRDHRAELENLASRLRVAASTRYDRAAGQLGVTAEIPPDRFAVMAQKPVDELMRIGTGPAFRFRFELAGTGAQPPHLLGPFARLFRAQHLAGGVNSSALDIRTVPTALLTQLDQDQQNLTISSLNQDNRQVRVARRAELAEAAALFFVPRAMPYPTPGLPSALDALRSTGTPLKPFVFISYARRDLPYVHGLLRAFQRTGIPYWWDGNLVGGDDIGASIDSSLRHPNCAAVLLVVGPVVGQRDWVASELRTADRRGLPVVSVCVNHASPPADNRLSIDLSSWRPDDQDDRRLRAVFDALQPYLLIG